MKNIFLDVSVIIPVWNVATVVEKVLASIVRQEYPIREIIIIDNHSIDNSVAIIKKFINKHKQITFKLVEREKTHGVSSSYNLGVKLAKSKFIISLHSDSVLPTTKEIQKLVKPFLQDKTVVATYPLLLHPKTVWGKYNFWQKYQFAPVVGTARHSMNGKFDCYKKSIYQKAGGYDEKKFGAHVGSEDADMHFRLKKFGKVIPTEAKVVHLHSFNKKFSLRNLLSSRKFLSIAYGAQIRYYWKEMNTGIIIFLIKPLLALSVFCIFLNPIFLVPLVLFPFLYMKEMFLDKSTLLNFRIFLLPFTVIFFLYYESFWMFYSLFHLSKRRK